jgi:hypothetical protein
MGQAATYNLQTVIPEVLMAKAICANCNAPIPLGPDADEGQLVTCDQCKATLKLVTDGEYLLTEKTA